MFIVLKSQSEDFKKSEDKSHIKWYHAARKMYEDVEITQLSGRTLEEIQKTNPTAFEECLHDIVPVKYETLHGVFEKPEEKIPVKAVPRREVGESKYRCQDCQLGSESIGGIRRHITKMHGKGKCKVICIETGLPVEDEPEIDLSEVKPILEQPERTETIIAPSVPEPEVEMKFKCELCGLKTPALGGVRRHITKMHGKGACKVIDLSTNLPLEEVNDDAPPAFQIADEKAKEAEEAEATARVENELMAEQAVAADVVFTRPKPVKRDF